MSMQVVADIVQTFGPFLIPATLFVVGIAGYAMLWVLTGRRNKWAATHEREDSSSDER